MKPRFRLVPLFALAAILLVFPPAAAQYPDNSYDADERDDGIRQSVARVSWFQGGVSFNRGDDPDDWQPASINYPMTLGDRIWAARDARVELQLRGGTVYLGPESELAALDLARDVRQLSLTLGTASFRIRRLERDEIFEVATPNVSVTFETPGSYRIDVDEDGNSRVSVTQGRAWVAAGAAHYLAGADAAQPGASPLHADLQGLPPTLIQTGTDDLVHGEALRLHDALAEVHVRAIRGDIAASTEVPRLIETHLHAPYAYPALRQQLEASAERVLRDYLSD